MDDLNNPVLLIRGHFFIRGEAEAAAEKISSHINAGAIYVSICAASAIAFVGDEGVVR